MAQAKALIESAPEFAPLPQPDNLEQAAEAATSNNDFGMLNDYYTTNVGQRLDRLKDRDAKLSYAASEEYGDLRLLFEACRQKGIEPLFIHVPMHGQWSDYTGFSAERRQEYYETLSALSKKTGVSFSKIVNQCIGYALDRMGNDESSEKTGSAK